MFHHVVFGVRDYTASKAVFLKALEPLGVTVVGEDLVPVKMYEDISSVEWQYLHNFSPV